MRATRPRCSTRSPAATSATRRPRRSPVPDDSSHLPACDDEAAADLRGKRLGLPREYFVAGHGAGRRGPRPGAVAALEAAGATVDEVSLPHTDYGLATYYIVGPGRGVARTSPATTGSATAPRRATATSWPTTSRRAGRGFGAEVKRRIMLGTYALSAGYYDAFYLKAQKVRTLIKADFDAVWAAGFDAIVAPTSPAVAFRFGAKMADPVAMYLIDACTLPVNMAGLPGLSIPCGLSDGLPVGLQLIGAPWTEPELLRLARAYEAITAGADWRSLEPTDLAASHDPATPTPAERAAALA